ncbi:Ig-like domain-containing protein [Myxococcus sp. MxC21-1]|uniref:Ig-like domain-containing protein n=1 Tax=Myxococcus sp. MxC21-1 TaxID=3041439 RepID=UPI00292FB414|nr:Ig-like domain-containing protein [Myxococcus sp. MxC21-1]WNZ61994.1 Ig-like domain-containing protein [Myxococcus sp. MxC21-1]
MNISERFLPPPWTAAVVLLCASACINVPAVEPAQAEVRITAPAGTAYTNGVVEVRLDVTGHAPDRVELLKDGEVLAELAPPYTYTWDTAGEAEGTYRLEARAALGDVAHVSASREVVVDRTPPRVVSRVPEQGAQEVWVQSPIRAEFSEPVKQSTVTTESVHLTVGDVAVAHTVSLSEDGKTVTVVPVTQMTAPSTVALAFSGTVTDLAGNAAVNLGEAWSWAVPEFVPYPPHPPGPTGPHDDIEPYIQLDANGNPSVLTLRLDRADEQVHLNLFVNRWTGSHWEQIGSGLKTSSTEFSINTPSIQLLPDGTPVVAWIEDFGAEFNNYIHVAKWDGTAWVRYGGEQGIIPERPHASGVALQLTSQGHPTIAVAMNPEDIEGEAVHIHQWTGEQWHRLGSALRDDPPSGTRYPALVLDSNDNPFVTFATGGSLNRTLAWRWTGNDWEQLGDPTATNTYLHSPYGLKLALSADNSPIVSWIGTETGTSRMDFHSSEWSPTRWASLGSPPRQLATSNRAIYEAKFTPQEGLFVLSIESNAEKTLINLNRRTNGHWGQVWSRHYERKTGKSPHGRPSMAVDSRGNIVVAWVDAIAHGAKNVFVYRRNR